MIFIENCSVHTVRAYKVDLAQAFNFSVDELSPSPKRPDAPLTKPETEILMATVRDAQRRWGRLGPASRNRKTATMKSFLGWLHRESYIEQDLSALLNSPKVPSRLPKHLSVDEAIVLIRLLQGEVTQLEAKSANETELISARINLALVALLYGGGLRVSEACELETANSDWNSGYCRFLGKGSNVRIIALPSLEIDAVAYLKSALLK
jgi:integrase/recombinase XerC/integrase/recombinase XerD